MKIIQPDLSDLFFLTIKIINPKILEDCEREYRFHETRRWRFDFAWKAHKIAVECDGIAKQAGGGRHNTDADRDKINTATMNGWKVFRFSGKQIRNEPDKCLSFFEKFIKVKKIDE